MPPRIRLMASTFDGIGMGLGFTVALTCIGLVREILGAGAFFGMVIIPEDFHISIFILAPGAFFVLAILNSASEQVQGSIGHQRFRSPVQTGVRRRLLQLFRLFLHGEP